MHFRNSDLWQKIKSHTTELLFSSSSQDVLGCRHAGRTHTRTQLHTPLLQKLSEHKRKHVEYILPDPAFCHFVDIDDTVPARATDLPLLHFKKVSMSYFCLHWPVIAYVWVFSRRGE